ncbi:MAG: hypothetical protein JRN35_10545 [Nitrososphaerota archaeon]|nr:hypothetical protein [Nitrososphaerota archaeon]
MSRRPSRPIFPEARALRTVFAERAYLLALVALSPMVGLFYAWLLQATLLGTVQLWVLRYVTLPELLFSLAMAFLVPAVFLTNVYILRHPDCDCAPRGHAGEGLLPVLVVGLMPNLLCCTPFVPAVLAIFLSGVTLISVSGPFQYFLGVYAPLLYTLTALSVWGSLRIASRRLAGMPKQV